MSSPTSAELMEIAKRLYGNPSAFNIRRTVAKDRLVGMRVTPGEAHLQPEASEGFDQWHHHDCTCADCRPEPDHVDTLPTAFPAAPAAPEYCPEEYYGISCTHKACAKPHRLPRRNT